MIKSRVRCREEMVQVQSLFDHDQPSRRCFRVINRYVGNLAPMPGVFYPARQRLDQAFSRDC